MSIPVIGDDFKPDKTPAKMKTVVCNLLLATALVFGVAMVSAQTSPVETQASDNIQTLKGKIGPYAVTMQLAPRDFEEGRFVGSYFYNDRPNSKFRLKLVKMETINLHGSMKVVLEEYTATGRHTGTFNGQYECRGDYFAGTFTNSQGRKFKFVLE
jgi:hypothetical protein